MPFLASLAACPPGPFPEPTVAAIIAVESGGDPWAVHVNGLAAAVPHPPNASAATAEALHWIAAGYTVDLGLMQVNSANLAALGVTVADMFEPCRNIAAGAFILFGDYAAALKAGKTGQDAAAAALSAYNTGNFVAGIDNGYVTHYDLSGGIGALAALPGGSRDIHYSFNVNFADWDSLLAVYQAAKLSTLQHIRLSRRDFETPAVVPPQAAAISLRHMERFLRLEVRRGRTPRATPAARSEALAGSVPLHARDFRPSS
ncbi:lytic transglycosylase domain-containing protein [Acidisoma sp. C75]